jgi:serine protease Do
MVGNTSILNLLEYHCFGHLVRYLKTHQPVVFLNYRHGKSSLGISIAIQSQKSAQYSHDFVLNRHELNDEPYSVRKRDLAISTSKRRDGFTRYARSSFVNGSWSTILLSASKADEPLLTAMAASIKVGRAPRLAITPNGQLEQAIYKTAELLRQAAEDDDREPANDVSEKSVEAAPRGSESGSGSGFYVSGDGTVMTNAHVVEGCGSVFVDDMPAKILAQSSEFDLALLSVVGATTAAVAVFSASSANLNADVTAVGFPYGGLLGGLNVTRGSVSALKGLSGDLTTMQITAPIQTGNSGGPVLASDGEVIGVVVSKLDAQRTNELIGDTPQNVNFAVRGEIARLFMSQNGVEPTLSLDNIKLEPEALAKLAAKFTVFVECR